MANKQSLPTMNETKSSFVNTSSMGNVVAPEYKEQKWSTVARIGEGIVGVSNAFKNMKHTEMMAKLDNLAQQNLHKLGDATDPSQLPDLINDLAITLEEKVFSPLIVCLESTVTPVFSFKK